MIPHREFFGVLDFSNAVRDVEQLHFKTTDLLVVQFQMAVIDVGSRYHRSNLSVVLLPVPFKTDKLSSENI